MYPHIYTPFIFKKFSVFICKYLQTRCTFLWGKWMRKSVTLKSLTVFHNPFGFAAYSLWAFPKPKFKSLERDTWCDNGPPK